MRMKLHEKIWMYLLNVCVVMLAICCIVLSHEIDILKDRVFNLEATKPIKTLSMVMDLPDASELESHEPPGRTYFDVPLEEELQDYIFDICEEYGVDPELIVSMIFHESNFDSAAIGENDSGYSYGLMQIMPRWNYERMERLGCLDLLNPYQNVLVGVDLVAEYVQKGYGIEWALMAYNGGPSYANRKAAEGVVSGYVTRITDYANGLCRASESLRMGV